LVIIAAIAYFGVLQPTKLLPSRCNFGSEFQCLDYQISSTDSTFKMRLKNGVGASIDVSAITLSTESTTAYTCTTAPVLPTGWNSGQIKDLTWSVCSGGGLVAGEKGKIKVAISYNTLPSGAAYTKQVDGEVFTTVI